MLMLPPVEPNLIIVIDVPFASIFNVLVHNLLSRRFLPPAFERVVVGAGRQVGRTAMSALLLIATGCGGSEDGGQPGALAGSSVGEVVPELELWGYVRVETTGLATDATLGPVSWASIQKSTSRSHALIHVSGFT